jgi:hypothetical protein
VPRILRSINRKDAAMFRILVVANETVAANVLTDAVRDRTRGTQAQVFVVAPALTGRLAYWSSADGAARRNANRRLTRCLQTLDAIGIDAEGHIGDADPLLAIDDALRMFPADEIIVATHPEGQSNWLARDVVGRARSRVPLPVHHIVVGQAEVRAA